MRLTSRGVPRAGPCGGDGTRVTRRDWVAPLRTQSAPGAIAVSARGLRVETRVSRSTKSETAVETNATPTPSGRIEREHTGKVNRSREPGI